MEQTLESTVLDSPWNDGNGILIENTHFNIITGHVAAFERTTNSALKQFAKGYLSIQYNAVHANAAVNGSVDHGTFWTSPQKQDTDDGQISALSILVNGMALNRTDDISSVPTDNSSPSSKRNNTGIIIGIVAGSLAFILAVMMAFIYFRKRQSKDQEHSLQSPFIITLERSNINLKHHTTQVHWNLQRNKKGLLQDSNSPSSIQHIAPSVNPSSLSDQHPVSQGEMQSREGDTRAVSTEELIRMLADRMQGEAQDGDFPPPYYAH
ncbi:hypothetical protein K435DRAFT_864379 [Dendrothele bispora CBS 962.96]|uniref:Uncharacterized protein n=1 Tax=Dendrothele bispora (strain CBS 962.96) TaxID=1314807 RepID=A0A4S8LMA0_DENBC|nr:hypothetical protein K435DRAFT_864379 [Dendrothele bispora CBS 962.96]